VEREVSGVRRGRLLPREAGEGASTMTPCIWREREECREEGERIARGAAGEGGTVSLYDEQYKRRGEEGSCVDRAHCWVLERLELAEGDVEQRNRAWPTGMDVARQLWAVAIP
jgi:hypothetical protein